MTIGVLAIQGDFAAHQRRLVELGAEVLLIRKSEQLSSIDALVIPGGESTTILKFLERDGFLDRLRIFARERPVFGTCAGAILLASEVASPPQRSLEVLDMSIRRNAYGRQADSSIRQGETTLGDGPLEMVFIRAPRIERVGLAVEVLARQGGDPVLVRQGMVMAATFHPELSQDVRVHAEFLRMARNGENGLEKPVRSSGVAVSDLPK